MPDPWIDLVFPVKIGMAAIALDLHQQTLRGYEREGLVIPGRTPKGTRLYSRDDLNRLVRVKALCTHGVNLAGIRIILGLEADPTAPKAA